MKTIIASFAALIMITACSSKKKEAEKAAAAPAPAPATAPAMSGSTTDSSTMSRDSSMSSHDKALEMCKAMHSEGDCEAMAMKCSSDTDVEACLKRQQ